MQCCTDCGHTNRPGVHFCTHCGKPTTAPGAPLSGPTAIVAGVVLAVGLLAFLTIRPVTSTLSTGDASAAAVLPQGEAGAPSPEGGASALAVVTPDVVQAVPPDAAAGSTPAGDEDSMSVDEAPDEPTTSDVAAPDPSTSGVETPDPAISASPDAATDVQTTDAQATVAVTPSEPVAPSVEPSSPKGPAPSLTDAFGAFGASAASIDAEALEWMTPAGSPPAPPLALGPPSAPPHPAQRHEDAEPPTTKADAPTTQAPSGATSTSRASSSTTAKRAALDTSAAGRAEAVRSRASPSWLRKLRVELGACEGNLIVRTVCEETAKLRRCSAANAWGEVPECPAARLPDLATFN